MERRGIVLIVAVGAALALPARAHAVDHLVLDISPTRVAAPVAAKASKQKRARVKALAPWRLHGRVVGRDRAHDEGVPEERADDAHDLRVLHHPLEDLALVEQVPHPPLQMQLVSVGP